MNHQWNYVLGLPDPRDATGERGLAAFNFSSIWVNAEGKRFTREFGDPKANLADLLRQPGGTYWSLFDERGRPRFSVTLAGWERSDEVAHLVYDRPGAAVQAGSLDGLAQAIGVPRDHLRATVERYNQLTVEGVDEDFGAFGPRTSPAPRKIETAPFYAVPFFPITRKSMGGVNVDARCRVLDGNGQPVSGLYAAGEVTGFAGINGKAALEGTFLGPAILMGRITGQAIGASRRARPSAPRDLPPAIEDKGFDNGQCLRCHAVAGDVRKSRPGYWHYEQSHSKLLARNYGCAKCHSELYPYQEARHRLSRAVLLHHCVACHGVQSTEAPVAP